MVEIFTKDVIMVEEMFVKNQITCSFATGNDECTLGFIDVSSTRPMSLVKGNELDLNKAKNVKLLLRKHKDKEKFDEIIIGNPQILMEYYEIIKTHIDDSLIPPNKMFGSERKLPETGQDLLLVALL